MQKYISIHLDHLHFRSIRQINQEYLSFLYQDHFYFSKIYSHDQIENFSIDLNHALLIPIQEHPLDTILLQVWENHMILFEHSIDISELNTRGATRKKLQVRQGQILQYSMHLLENKEIIIKNQQQQTILQHYMVLNNFKAEENGQDTGPSYFMLEYSQGDVIIPVFNATAMIPLPTSFKFYHIKNGKVLSKSKLFRSDDVQTSQMRVQMIIKEDSGYDLELKIQWVTNLNTHWHKTSALLGAHDILLSQIEIRFEARDGMKIDLRPDHIAGSRFKVTSGNKAFELNGDLDPLKPNKFARLIYFIVKSEEEDFAFTLEKGPRIMAKATIGTDQLLSYHPNVLKKKLLDPFSGRVVATVKFRGEKAKNLSLPQNNLFWKQSSQGRNQAMMLQLSQISLFGANQPCNIQIRSEQHQVFIQNVPDFGFFKLETELPSPTVLTIKHQGNIYFKLIPCSSREGDFLGMGVINPKELRMGAVPIALPFYKQQQLVCEARMIVNKAMPWPFVKGMAHPESLIGSSIKSMSLSVTLKGIELTSYFWSYLYEGKGDFYCIFQINRVKKVVILQRMTMTEKLLFLTAPGSDLLNFVLDQQQSFKIKFTILASDQGVQEEIYGVVQKRVKIEDIESGALLLKKQPIANSANLHVGQLDFEVQKGLIGEFKRLPLKKELNLVKQDLDKINRSIEKVQKKRSSPQPLHKQYKSKKRYDSLVLPEIKDPKQERLKRLAKALQARQHRRRYPKVPLTERDTDNDVKAGGKSRVQSQGISGLKRGLQDSLQDPLPPLPHTVREQVEDQRERNSSLHIELPQNEFEENQFAEPLMEGNPDDLMDPLE